MDCPVCGKPKLIVNVKKKTWHCWVCQKMGMRKTHAGIKLVALSGAGGLLDLIELLEGCSRKDAVDLVIAGSSLKIADLYKIDKGELFFDEGVPPSLVAPTIPPPLGMMPISTKSHYLVSRGISPSDAATFRLGWCRTGPYADRLVFPVYEQSRLVYWQARAMWQLRPGEKKVLNPKSQPGYATSGEVLINLDVARQYPRVCITEGPIDCVHAGYDAVATLGKHLSPVQVGKLIQAGVTAVDLMWDGPSEREPYGAWADMLVAGELLRPFVDVRLVRLPCGDPGDWPREKLDYFRRNNYVDLDHVSHLERI